jgi:hypothetical protein
MLECWCFVQRLIGGPSLGTAYSSGGLAGAAGRPAWPQLARLASDAAGPTTLASLANLAAGQMAGWVGPLGLANWLTRLFSGQKPYGLPCF